MILEESRTDQLGKEIIDLITSSDVLFYAAGKVLSGVTCDSFGGHKTFLLGKVGSIIAKVSLGLQTGATAFMLIWSMNRLIQ